MLGQGPGGCARAGEGSVGRWGPHCTRNMAHETHISVRCDAHSSLKSAAGRSAFGSPFPSALPSASAFASALASATASLFAAPFACDSEDPVC